MLCVLLSAGDAVVMVMTECQIVSQVVEWPCRAVSNMVVGQSDPIRGTIGESQTKVSDASDDDDGDGKQEYRKQKASWRSSQLLN